MLITGADPPPQSFYIVDHSGGGSGTREYRGPRRLGGRPPWCPRRPARTAMYRHRTGSDGVFRKEALSVREMQPLAHKGTSDPNDGVLGASAECSQRWFAGRARRAQLSVLPEDILGARPKNLNCGRDGGMTPVHVSRCRSTSSHVSTCRSVAAAFTGAWLWICPSHEAIPLAGPAD